MSDSIEIDANASQENQSKESPAMEVDAEQSPPMEVDAEPVEPEIKHDMRPITEFILDQ